MQHEDRILKSIDLLTYNARETLNKVSIWATSKDSSVTFNLYDALPTYENGGGSGSAIFQKPITIPSFNSISSGIFGTAGTTATRDIFWNFRFLANGSGWVFDKYVQDNNGMPSASGIEPVLEVRTNAVFGKDGVVKTVVFNNTDILYNSQKTNLSLNNGQFVIKTPLFSVSGNRNGDGVFEAFSDIISLGDSYGSPTNIPSSLISMVAKRVTISGTSQASSKHNILDSLNGTVTVGDFNANVTINSNAGGFKFSQFAGFNLTAVGTDTLDKIYLINAINSGLDKIDVFAFQSAGSSSVNNLIIGGNYTNNTLLGRFATVSSEGFQLFSKSKMNNSTDKSSVPAYFDAWIDAGVDGSSSAVVRGTSQYAALVNGFVDPSLVSAKTNPFYFNLGTKGSLNVVGGDSVNVSSDVAINLLIGTSPEVLIEKGKVTIPNLDVPAYSIHSLSTLRKSSYLRFNEQVKIFPFSQTTLKSGADIISGMEVTTNMASDRSLVENDKLYLWATFSPDYRYAFYLVNDTESTYKLMCDSFANTVSGLPNYGAGINVATVITGIPKLETDGSKFYHNRIRVIATQKSVYVVYVDGFTVKFYQCSDLTGSSFIKLSSEYGTSYNFLKMDVNAITANDVTCACGNKDKVWVALELSDGGNKIIPTVICYNETSDVILSAELPSSYDNTSSTSGNGLGSVLKYSTYTNAVTALSGVTGIVSSLFGSRGNKTVTNSYSSAIVMPSSDTYNAYKLDNASHMKIVSIFTQGGKFNAYVLLHLSDSFLNDHKIKIFKLNINTTTDTLSVVGATNTPIRSSGSEIYVPNELIINEASSNNFQLHTILSKYTTNGKAYSSTSGRKGFYGGDLILNWSESTELSSTTVVSSNPISKILAINDDRYELSQTTGWSSSTNSNVLSLFYFDNTPSYTSYIFSSLKNSLSEATPATTINFASSVSSENRGLMLPFSPFDIVIENGSSIKYKYDRTLSGIVDYRVMSQYIKTIVKYVNYIDTYKPLFSASFIDAFGTSAYLNEIHSTIFSNLKSGIYKYGIGDYDASNIVGTPDVIVVENNNEIDQVVLVGNSLLTNFFKKVNLAKANDSIVDGVNVTMKIDSNVVNNSVMNPPVSVFAKCKLNSEPSYSTSISRNGIFNNVSNTAANGINLDIFGNGYLGASARNVGYVPVELVSIFSKRVSQNNLTNISRSDFNLTIVTSIPNVTISTTSLTLAYVQWNDVINSGHEFPWIYDPFVNNPYVSIDEMQSVSKNAYLVKNTGKESVPYNSSFIKSAYLVYDPTFNRVHVLMVPDSNYHVDITNNYIAMDGSVIIVSFNNSAINPFDKDFDSTMCILNSSNNVVSIRVDGYGPLAIKKLGAPSISNLILGYTETNFIESSC